MKISYKDLNVNPYLKEEMLFNKTFITNSTISCFDKDSVWETVNSKEVICFMKSDFGNNPFLIKLYRVKTNTSHYINVCFESILDLEE